MGVGGQHRREFGPRSYFMTPWSNYKEEDNSASRGTFVKINAKNSTNVYIAFTANY